MGLIGGVSGQNGFNMPYSQFGIGICEMPYNMPMVTRMGGATYTRSGNNYINPFNPASYGGIETESFVFDMAMNMEKTRLQSHSGLLDDADGNLSYLAFGLALTKWWKLAGGLMPYSTVDYESVALGTYLDSNVVKTSYGGTGGTSLVFLGNAFNVLDGKGGRRLQVGFNVGYLTGNIQREISYTFVARDTTYYMNKNRLKDTKIGNLLFDFGVQWWEPLGEGYRLGVALTYKPYRKMNIDEELLVYTYHTNIQSLCDTVFPAAGQSPSFTSTLEQDHTVGVGLSLERNDRWLVAMDATFAGWSGMKYTEGLGNSTLFGQSAWMAGPYSRYALGFEKTGTMDASSYWGRISWSAGVHVEQGVMRLYMNGKENVIDEWGCGLGATLPMRKGRSLLTLSVGYRSLGTKDILQRNSLTFGIAVSSCERWFVQRKYN